MRTSNHSNTSNDHAATHSVPQQPLDRQAQYPLAAIGRLGIAILRDGRLRRSALSVAVLSGLIVYGAGETATEVPLRELAADLGSSYDPVYKAVGRLAALGYVRLSRAKHGQRRLSMRVVWPQDDPAGHTEG